MPTIDPWLTDEPYTEDIIARVNNHRFRDTTREKENAAFAGCAYLAHAEACAALKSFGIEEMPERVQAALNHLRKAEYDSYLRWIRGFEIAPPMAIVGPANYHKHARPEKRDRCIEIGMQAVEAAKERLERAIQACHPKKSGISSDDVDALLQIDDRIAELTQWGETMRQANAIIKGQGASAEKIAALLGLGIDEKEATERVNGAPWLSCPGYMSVEITSTRASVKRLEERRKRIDARRGQSDSTAVFDGGRVLDNVTENRLQVLFDVKPSEEIRDALKARGFHWSGSKGVWQRMRGRDARLAAEGVLGVTLHFE